MILPEHSPTKEESSSREILKPGVILLPKFVRNNLQKELEEIFALSLPRHMETKTGKKISIAMTNCGEWGWISDSLGYRYTDIDPVTQKKWPLMPASFLEIANTAAHLAGYPCFIPDSCLVNVYRPGDRLGLHQDKDEKDFEHPIVSVSLGLDAQFLIGGNRRQDPYQSILLQHGDVIVFGGVARKMFHGIQKVFKGVHQAFGEQRINLTFRQAK